MRKLYIIYDGRAIPWEHQCQEVKCMIKKRQAKFKDGEKFRKMFFPGDTDEASVLESCESLEEARENASGHGSGNCIYEYDIKGKKLVNERFVEVVK